MNFDALQKSLKKLTKPLLRRNREEFPPKFLQILAKNLSRDNLARLIDDYKLRVFCNIIRFIY